MENSDYKTFFLTEPSNLLDITQGLALKKNVSACESAWLCNREAKVLILAILKMFIRRIIYILLCIFLHRALPG